MEPDWDEYETDTSVDELWTELESIRNGVPGRRPIVRKSLTHVLKIGIVAVAIVIAVGVSAAVVLFSHSFGYTAPSQKLSTTCSSLAATSSGSTIVFACSSNPAISVASTATGSVTYSAFNPTPPVSILDVYLIDTAVTLAATCGTTSSTGSEPVSMSVGGGTITISQSAGNLRPNHNYNYCMDFAVLPPSFTTGVTWSQ
jgi:hypothetical protein